MQAAVIRFTTSLFDVSKERPNNINPIPGESLLLWLAQQVEGDLSISPPAREDWGWYSDVEWRGRSYMLGSCAYDEEHGQREWALQIVKHRSFKECLLGREKMTPADECVRFFRSLVEREPAFSNFDFEFD
jgi:hypothetical protein